MKIKQGYILREVGTLAVVVAVGAAHENFHKILTLNKTGAFLFNMLTETQEYENLVNALCDKYDVDFATAQCDVDEFINQLKSVGLLDD